MGSTPPFFFRTSIIQIGIKPCPHALSSLIGLIVYTYVLRWQVTYLVSRWLRAVRLLGASSYLVGCRRIVMYESIQYMSFNNDNNYHKSYSSECPTHIDATSSTARRRLPVPAVETTPQLVKTTDKQEKAAKQGKCAQ